MKRKLALIIVVVLIGSMLMAAAPSKVETLRGILRWQHNNICDVSDYVSLPVMDNAYLTGKFVPTQGKLQGCVITATGTSYSAGKCHYFAVDQYSVSCDTALFGGVIP